MYSYFIAWSVAHVMTHAHIRTMFNDQVRALIVFKRILHCNTRIFCSRKSEIIFSNILLMQCCADHSFSAINNIHKYKSFSIAICLTLRWYCIRSQFSSIDVSSLPICNYPVNKYLSKCFESMCACFLFCKPLLLWFHRANNVFSMLVLFATFFRYIAAAVLCFQ